MLYLRNIPIITLHWSNLPFTCGTGFTTIAIMATISTKIVEAVLTTAVQMTYIKGQRSIPATIFTIYCGPASTLASVITLCRIATNCVAVARLTTLAFRHATEKVLSLDIFWFTFYVTHSNY